MDWISDAIWLERYTNNFFHAGLCLIVMILCQSLIVITFTHVVCTLPVIIVITFIDMLCESILPIVTNYNYF